MHGLIVRLMGTVHQEGLSTEEKILRYFDMSSQYGVSCLLVKCKCP